MRLKNKPLIISSPAGDVHLQRTAEGVPVIEAPNEVALAFGLGWVHACDRQLQALLMRILLQGRAAEHLKNDAGLIEIDRFMRRFNFLPDRQQVEADLEPAVRAQLEAYAQGFNTFLSGHPSVFELRLLGYRPDPWEVADSLLIGKAFGFIGLADAQGAMQKFLIQLVQNGLGETKLRELFPYLKEPVDVDLIKKIVLEPPLVPEAVKWLDKLPRFNASNNWAVSGRLTVSGKPIVCGDPHLEVNRLPAIWQEIVMHLPDNDLLGTSIPGVPGLIVGRTQHLAWSPTYSFMDMLDFRVEECRDGCYRRPDGWKPFAVREETIRVKKGAPIHLKVYENEHGLLEGDPFQEGHYLVVSWSARSGCGAGEFNSILNLPGARTVREAQSLFKRMDAASFNWVIADTAGDIGYQMSGRCFQRPKGVSGLLPTPGWDRASNPVGFVAKERLPSAFNPEDGYIVTANQDLNHLGTVEVINLPMGAYRAERIRQLLASGARLSADDMQAMHYDLYSLQAERFMEVIAPLLPDTPNGRLLKTWDRHYHADSKGATLFEAVYEALIRTLCGANGVGPAVVDYVFKETGLFHDYYANLDAILLNPESAWFTEQTQKDVFSSAIEIGLQDAPRPYGETRRVVLAHLLFGGQLPRWLGFDYGPIALPGSRATVTQGQIFKNAGRLTTFSPSYRMIADLATDELRTNIAGGPSDRRFSRWYLTDIDNWLKGRYKLLR